jgi:hypothetical protein
VYLDDILVTEHLQTLELVLERLAQTGFRLKAWFVHALSCAEEASEAAVEPIVN